MTIADVNAEKGEALADELGREFVACDVREEEQVEAAVEAAAEADGGLRIAVCCAGTGWAQKVAGSRGPHPLQPFETIIEINLIGTFNVAALRRQRDDRQRAARRRRARRLRQHRVDRRLRRPGRPDRLLGVQGRRRRHDAAGRARPRAVRHPRRARSRRACSTRRCSRRCPRRRATTLGAGDPVPAAPGPARRSTRSSPRRSSRTRCSTARRSASTARCGWRRADQGFQSVWNKKLTGNFYELLSDSRRTS